MIKSIDNYLIIPYQNNYYYIIDSITGSIVSKILNKKEIKKRIQELQINNMMDNMLNNGVIFSKEKL
jgi:hypothetical protein